MDLKIFLIWYLSFFLLGIIGLPITFKLFPKWKDHGYGFAKFIGLFIVAMPVWLLASLKIFSFTQTLIWVWFFIVGIVMVALYIKWKVSFNKYIFFQELLFFLLLLIWTFIRSGNSQIEGTEKFMNLAFMNSINRSDFFPPNDPWLAGNTINYYYLGHYLFAAVAKLTAIKMSYIYNFALVTIIAHAFISLNSIFLALLNGKYKLLGIIIGLMGSLWICFGGNMHYAAAWAGLPLKKVECVAGDTNCTGPRYESYWKDGQFSYWFPDGTRIIPNTINEFPAYSIVLGDVHGHYLGFPFLIIALGLAISSTKIPVNSKLRVYFNLAISPLVVALYGINTWDFITINFIFFLIHFYQLSNLKKHFKYKLKMLAVQELALLLPGILFFMPYLLNFKPPVAGISIAGSTAGGGVIESLKNLYENLPFGFVPLNIKSDFGPWLIMWAMFLVITIFFLINLKLNKIKVNHAVKISVFLTLCAFFLITLVEFVFLKDIFNKANPPYFRTNTVFKIYYHAWVIWGIAATCAAFFLVKSFLQNLKLPVPKIWKIFQLIVILTMFIFWLGSLSYIFKAVKDFYPTVIEENQFFIRANQLLNFYLGNIIDSNNTENPLKYSFDGNYYIKRYHSGDYYALEWLNKNISGQHIILEAVGDAYTYFARVSTNTGLTTVMGWPSHEWQWRGSADDPYKRKGEVEKMYTTTDFNELTTLLKNYQVKYIFVGEKEREAYLQLNEKFFTLNFDKIYEADDTRIYKVEFLD